MRAFASRVFKDVSERLGRGRRLAGWVGEGPLDDGGGHLHKSMAPLSRQEPTRAGTAAMNGGEWPYGGAGRGQRDGEGGPEDVQALASPEVCSAAHHETHWEKSWEARGRLIDMKQVDRDGASEFAASLFAAAAATLTGPMQEQCSGQSSRNTARR